MPAPNITTNPLGLYCDTYHDLYGVCEGDNPHAGGIGGSYNRPYIGPALTYFGGTSADAPSVNTPWPFPIALGGHEYVIDLKYYERSSVEPFREASDFNASPGEHSLTNEGAWKRNRSDWSWGAGQTWADDPDSSDKRFHASKGVNIWTPRSLSLLHDADLVNATTEQNLAVFVVDGFVYLIDGPSVVRTSDPVNGPYSTLPVPAAIAAACTDGTRLFVAVTGTGIYETVAGSASITAMGGAAGTYNADLVGYANGWLLATQGPDLSSVAADGTMVVVDTHQNPAWRWTAIASAPNAIYISGTAGDHSEIYQITVNQTTGALAVPVFAGSTPEGESVAAMCAYQGALTLGTSRGVRLAQIDGSGNTSVGPLIDLHRPVTSLHSRGEFVWFSWRDYDPASTGLGRANLSVFTSPLVPAYASDLMAATQGDIGGIVTFNDTLYFTVNGAGLYAQSTNLVAEGVIEQGNFTYSIFDPKALMSVELITAPLNGSVAMVVTDDHGHDTPIGTATTHDSTGIGTTYSGHDVVAEQLGLTLTLTCSPLKTFGPTVRRFSVRALPVPSNVELFTVPIMLKETVNVVAPGGEGEDRSYDVAAEIDFLKNLEGSRRPVTYQEGNRSYRVTVRATRRPQGLTYTWDSTHRAIEGVFMVLLATLES